MLRIQLLGSFQVDKDEKPVIRLQSERLQALLAYLVLHRAQPQSRQQLAVTFWPDTTDGQAAPTSALCLPGCAKRCPMLIYTSPLMLSRCSGAATRPARLT